MSNLDSVPSNPRRDSSASNGNGGGDNTNERLARLEERTNHLATSAQLEEIKTSVEKLRSDMKWIGVAIASVSVSVILITTIAYFNVSELLEALSKALFERG